MRAYIFLLCCGLAAACKPGKEKTPDPLTGYKHQLNKLELIIGRVINIDGNHDTAFRYFGRATYDFAINPPVGIAWELGGISYGGIVLPAHDTVPGNRWPDSVTFVPEYGTWHMAGNAYFNTVDYTDNMPWPVLDSLPDTIHLGEPFILSVRDCEVVHGMIYGSDGGSGLLSIHDVGGRDTIQFNSPQNYDNDLMRFEVNAFVRSGSMPMLVKLITWNKWVRMIYP